MKELGNIGRDPKRYGTSDKAPYKFSVAINDRKKKLDGSREAMFLECVVFTDTPAFRTMEALSNSGYPLKTGSLILFEGELQQEEYEQKEKETGKVLGVKTQNIVRVFNIVLPKIGRPNSGQASDEHAAPAGVRNNAPAPAAEDDGGEEDFDI